MSNNSHSVMLANAGIQVYAQLNNEVRLDSRVRGNDGGGSATGCHELFGAMLLLALALLLVPNSANARPLTIAYHQPHGILLCPSASILLTKKNIDALLYAARIVPNTDKATGTEKYFTDEFVVKANAGLR